MARRKRSNHRGGIKVPIGIVAGLAPLAVHMYDGGKADGFSGVVKAGALDLTGYDLDAKKWDPSAMVKGWVPIVAGFVAHKLAGVFGINAALGRARIPLVRI